MFDRISWNKGVCRKSGKLWYHVESRFRRGPSISWVTEKFEDGCGNVLFVDRDSKVFKEYCANRTREIIEKEDLARARIERECQDREDKNRKIREEFIFVPPTFWEKWGFFIVIGGIIILLQLLRVFLK